MTRTINISLSAETLDALKDAGSALYAMKAVKFGFKGVPFSNKAMMRSATVPKGPGAGVPLAWLVRSNYLQNSAISWGAALQAYISQSPIVDQQLIVPGSVADVLPGQTLNVSATGGVSVASGGGEGAVTVVNQGTDPWTCGLEQGAGGVPAPTCAFPLYGQGMLVMTPLDQVFLMFAANLLPAGSVIGTAYSSGLLVDATAADRAVTFDINQGWSAGGAAWAAPVAPETNLSTLLITT